VVAKPEIIFILIPHQNKNNYDFPNHNSRYPITNNK
jgi:hypothetical protein